MLANIYAHPWKPRIQHRWTTQSLRARASCKRCGRASTDAAKLVTHQLLSPLPETPFAALVRSLFGGRVLPTVFRKVHRLGDLGWVDLIRFGIFRHLAQLHSQFCQIPSCTSQIGQTVEQPRSKSTQPKSASRWTSRYITDGCLYRADGVDGPQEMEIK